MRRAEAEDLLRPGQINQQLIGAEIERENALGLRLCRAEHQQKGRQPPHESRHGNKAGCPSMMGRATETP